jgi:hypothetical protein
MSKNTVLDFINGTNHFVEKSGPYPTIACWTDLLGFGAQLDSMNWDLEQDRTDILQARLSRFSQIFINTNSINENVIMINDGMLRTFDTEIYKNNKNKNEFIRWIHNCLVTHCVNTGNEKDYQLPGLRTVICEGEVFSYQYRTNHKFSKINQLNTALSKCYIADSLGSKIGLKKGSIYLDKNVLNTLIHTYGCRYYNNFYLSFFGPPLINDISFYQKITDLIYLKNRTELENIVNSDRTSWIKFGETIPIKKGNLTFELIEITHYSPIDEPAMFYFDTFRGDSHGIITSGFRPNSDMKNYFGDNKFRNVNKADLNVLKEYLDKLKTATNIGIANSGA